ncbi:MAG TPA: 5'/3'-nucleotidase SurE [Acidimicrobiales bacterium]
MTTRSLRVLVTNDDGIASPGLVALAGAIQAAGHETFVVAPADDRSGSSASLGRVVPQDRIRVQPVDLRANGDAVRACSMKAPPGLIAMAAVLGAFGDPPDVVASGVNLGPNTGHSILHSGTVGAVLTAQNFGSSGLAVSLVESDRWYWETAAAIAVEVLTWLAEAPRRTALNLNVPARPAADLQPLTWATLDTFGSVRAAVASVEGGLQFEFRDTKADLDPASDTALLAAGHPTLTALAGLCTVAPGTVVRRPEEITARLTESPSSTGRWARGPRP